MLQLDLAVDLRDLPSRAITRVVLVAIQVEQDAVTRLLFLLQLFAARRAVPRALSRSISSGVAAVLMPTFDAAFISS